jgi:8-oxo-dGTP pyrophosphatase MutT (NUDIX family)
MTLSKRRRGTALVEIEHAGERGILLTADRHFWTLPGGGPDYPSETRLSAAIRELREETGLRATAALYLFKHESRNLHKVYYMRAGGALALRDPREVRCLGLCRPDMSVVPILLAHGATPPPKLSEATQAIVRRYRAYRAEHAAFFDELDGYEQPAPASVAVERPVVPLEPYAPASFELLDRLTLEHAGQARTIAIYRGDLTAIPPEEAVDVLVVSALPGAYSPNRRSLIGALHRRGISVADLAREKAEDLRPALACWLSGPIARPDQGLQFRRILCFEPLTRGEPPEVVSDIFQCLAALPDEPEPIRSVAMPLLAGGVQGVSTADMLLPLFEAATHWLQSGLPLETIKIVAYSEIGAAELRSAFAVLKRLFLQRASAAAAAPPAAGYRYDLFVSYSWQNKDEVDVLVAELRRLRPGLRIFLDRLELKTGCVWQEDISNALDDCAQVVAVYSPAYLQSKVCREEFNIARFRDRESGGGVLLPIYLESASLPTVMKLVQYMDCRERDHARLRRAAAQIAGQLEGRRGEGVKG